MSVTLPLINWWVRYSNSYLKMTDLSITLTSSNRSFFSSKCFTVSGSILTSTNWDITPSLGSKCFWWNKHTDKHGAYHTSNPAPNCQLYIVQQIYLIYKWTVIYHGLFSNWKWHLSSQWSKCLRLARHDGKLAD